MKTVKFLLYAAIGVAVVLLLTTDKAKEMRDDLEDQARDKAKKWKSKWSKLNKDTSDLVGDLKNA